MGQLVLLVIFVVRKRAIRFPFFTAYLAFAIAQSVTNLAIYRLGSKAAYFWTYWGLAIVDVLAQLGVVYEMAHHVLRPAGTWSRQARAMFFILGSLGAALAAGLSFAVNPKAATALSAWPIRLDLFASLLIAELVVAMFIAADRVGLQWRNWVMGLAEGLGLWVGVYLCVETAHSYLGWTKQSTIFDNLESVAYLVALGWWSVSFWNAEPERKPLSPELQKYLHSMSDGLGYDLRKLDRLRKTP